MSSFQDLYEFIARATKNRKYAENTAFSLRAALKLYEEGLNEDEHKSLAKVKENFEAITQSVFRKNAAKFSAATLTTYKSRTLKVISDFEKYNDPAKMNSWNPTIIVRSKRQQSGSGKNGSETNGVHSAEESVPATMHRIELALRADAKIVLIVPKDMTEAECMTITTILKSLTTK